MLGFSQSIADFETTDNDHVVLVEGNGLLKLLQDCVRRAFGVCVCVCVMCVCVGVCVCVGGRGAGEHGTCLGLRQPHPRSY